MYLTETTLSFPLVKYVLYGEFLSLQFFKQLGNQKTIIRLSVFTVSARKQSIQIYNLNNLGFKYLLDNGCVLR